MNPAQVAKMFPHFAHSAPDGALEFYLDNQMLSSFRICEMKFIEEHIRKHPDAKDGEIGIAPKGLREWSLEFGTWLHECLEYYYGNMKENGSVELDKFLILGRELWLKYDMDYHKQFKAKRGQTKYEILGGEPGAIALLTEYYAYYRDQRLRVIATEIPFGRKKEVLLWEGWISSKYGLIKVRFYLTGRMDLVADNGYKIGPVDHKTTIRFDGNESNKFDPHDGVTGYIFATDAIMRSRFPDYAAKGRRCLSAWVFHISISYPSQEKMKQGLTSRFKVTPIDKTPEQLEEYRKRQIRTFRKLFQLLVGDESPDWNTTACGNVYGRECPYRNLHQRPMNQQLQWIQMDFASKRPWNPENPPKGVNDEALVSQ